MKILFVEPDEYYHPHFREFGEGLGEILVSRTAEAAKQLVQGSPPDLVITELLLPDGNGYEFLEFLREARGSNAFPVVVFSRVENLEDVKACLNYGINAYLVKGKDTLAELRSLILNLTPA